MYERDSVIFDNIQYDWQLLSSILFISNIQKRLNVVDFGGALGTSYRQNSKYLDAISSWWVNLHGHNHPYLMDAIRKQTEKLDHVIFSGFTHAPAVELSEALLKVFTNGKIGEFYNIGSNKNLNNLQVTKQLLKNSKSLIKIGNKVKINFVKDRPGHDLRYALNSNKIKNKLGWYPKTNFENGIKLTLDWYFRNKSYYKSLSKKDITNRLGKG